MATKTEYLGLTLPQEEDLFRVGDMNGNMETLDNAWAEMGEMGQTMEEMNEKMGSAADTGADTLFGLLQSHTSAVRSLQRVFYEYGDENRSIPIQEVDPARCLVIFERLYDHSTSGVNSVLYSLTSTTLEISHPESTSGRYRFSFWIIEFN